MKKLCKRILGGLIVLCMIGCVFATTVPTEVQASESRQEQILSASKAKANQGGVQVGWGKINYPRVSLLLLKTVPQRYGRTVMVQGSWWRGVTVTRNMDLKLYGLYKDAYGDVYRHVGVTYQNKEYYGYVLNNKIVMSTKAVATATPKPSAAPAPTAKPTKEPAATKAPSSTDDDYTTGSITAQEENAFILLNQDRSANGLPALKLDPVLCEIARAKSKDMKEKNYFSHTSPTYGSASQMLKSFGYSFQAVGENIAHHATVEKSQAAFMSSDGHRRNILGSQWTKVGIGVWYDAQGFVYVTQMFVR